MTQTTARGPNPQLAFELLQRLGPTLEDKPKRTASSPDPEVSAQLDTKLAPPPPPVPENLDAQERLEYLRRKNTAFNLKTRSAASYLAGAMQGIADDESLAVYLQDLLDAAVEGDDPIERMLIEQLVLAHHALGRLHIEAANAKSVQLVAAYNSAAARLLGEYRRLALALRDYRMPVIAKVVHGGADEKNTSWNGHERQFNGEGAG